MFPKKTKKYFRRTQKVWNYKNFKRETIFRFSFQFNNFLCFKKLNPISFFNSFVNFDDSGKVCWIHHYHGDILEIIQSAYSSFCLGVYLNHSLNSEITLTNKSIENKKKIHAWSPLNTHWRFVFVKRLICRVFSPKNRQQT